MKPQTKLRKINENIFNECLVCIGIVFCMCLPGIFAVYKCGRPGRTAHNSYTPFGNQFKENDKILYTCTEKNHVILENPERSCLRNGSWSDDIPVCYKEALIERAEIQDAEDPSLDNYTVDGIVSTCSEASRNNRTNWRGYLEKSIDVTAVQVSFIGIKHVDIDVQVQEENSSATKRCKIKYDDEGFRIKSIKTLTFYCPSETNGKYIHISCYNLALSLCEISVLYSPGSSCVSPDIPLHGYGSRKVINNLKTNYTFYCHDGYKVWVFQEVSCQADGRWSPKSPICEEIYCHPPDSIENGDVEYSETKGKIPYNGTATFSCKEGFYLFGQSVIRCHSFHTWDAPSPVCKLRVTENSDNARHQPQTDSWRQPNVTYCGNLPQVANGVLIVNSSYVGSTAWLKCSEGFRPLTDDRVICLPTGKWSLRSLHCTIIQCETNPIIPFGKGILLHNSSYYGSYLQITCIEGFASHSAIIHKCDENGSWGDLNICVEIACGDFSNEDAHNGQWIPVNGSASLSVLICPENFHIEGSPAVIRCLSNGSWSYTSARCQKSLSSLWGSNWTPSLVLIAAVAAGVATAVFILCLSVAFLVIKKRRQDQTNTTVFHLENTAQKERKISSQRQKHQSAAENYNSVKLRCKSTCTYPRKPRSALPNLPVDTDPVYAQPFETATAKQGTLLTTANKKDDLYNTHIYAEPVDSKRNTPTHIFMNIDDVRLGTDRRLSVTRTNLETELCSSVQTDQQNCDKKCAIYDSSENTSLNSMKITKEEYYQNHNTIELGTLKKKLEYLELL